MAKLSRIGQYKLVRKLGQGGMGAVFEGVQDRLDRRVAVKILPARFTDDPDFVERFKREAKASARLNHPNIVTVYEIGEDQGFHYFAMELVDGMSLHQRLESVGPFDVAEAVDLMTQTVKGLAHAWERSIIHRDLKPDNLMLTAEGVIKIADLGLARFRDDMDTLTKTGASMGTPYYMSPEQCANAKDADVRSDIYSLGATFYHLLTGRVPFEGSSPIEVAIKVATAPFPPVRQVRPKTPEPVATLIEKMLARSPQSRPQNASDLLAALKALATTRKEQARSPQASPDLEQAVAAGKLAVRCQSCGTSSKVPAAFAGKRARCKKCNAIVSVPTEEAMLELIDNDLPLNDTSPVAKPSPRISRLSQQPKVANQASSPGEFQFAFPAASRIYETTLFDAGQALGNVCVFCLINSPHYQPFLVMGLRTLDIALQQIGMPFPFTGAMSPSTALLALNSLTTQLGASRDVQTQSIFLLGYHWTLFERLMQIFYEANLDPTAGVGLLQQCQNSITSIISTAIAIQCVSGLTVEVHSLYKFLPPKKNAAEQARFIEKTIALKARIKDGLNSRGTPLKLREIVDRASEIHCGEFRKLKAFNSDVLWNGATVEAA